MGRLFSIADIHGEMGLLIKLWDKLQTDQNLDLTKDKVVFTGDYVDRGPDSHGVIAFLKNLVETYPGHVICLAGNHEWINIMYYVRKLPDDIWLHDNNGGKQTFESYVNAGYPYGMTPEHIKWLSQLPMKHEEPGFFFSHAPVPRDSYRNVMQKGLPDFSPEELMWTYHPDEKGVARDHGNGVVGVCGHIHQLRKGIFAPRFYDHYIYGDSGAGCSKKAPLCAINVVTRDVIYAWPDPVKKQP